MFRTLYSKQLIKGYLNFKNIITDSNDVKKKLSLISDSKEIEVIYPPCPPSFKPLEVTDLDKKRLNLPTDKILVLSPSNAMPWKNLAMVSRVMKKLGDKFVLVRVGPEIGTGITFSRVNSNTLNLLYNLCDLLLFPSLEEGFGFPLVEAMRTGLPAVVSDIDVFHEIAADAVEYVNPYDVDSIVEGIFRALNKSEELRKIGSRRSGLFSLEIFRNKMLTFYERVGRKIITKS
ncbi:MAG: glycosyltransferase [Candidatus Thermoplasmatota archaeon]|nr:glycosyltransferase [Candidatus Thermoplasmatota archaeon]